MVGQTISHYRVLLAGIFLTTVLVTARAPPESADLIITNGRVIDGKGVVYDRATIANTRRDDYSYCETIRDLQLDSLTALIKGIRGQKFLRNCREHVSLFLVSLFLSFFLDT